MQTLRHSGETINPDMAVVKRLCKAAFPDYNGRNFFIERFEPPMSILSFWDDGSRDYFAFVRTDGAVVPVHSNHPAFEPNRPNQVASLPADVCLVRRSYLCGKCSGLTLFVAEPQQFNLPPASRMLESAGVA